MHNNKILNKKKSSNLTQSVIGDGQSSEIGHIKSGVPQGAVLGPITFLIYINDIIEDISSDIKLFADDTSLFIEVDDPDIAAEVLNSDLDKIKIWADQWLVKFSAEKTRLMTSSFRSVDHPNIVLMVLCYLHLIHINILGLH